VIILDSIVSYEYKDIQAIDIEESKLLTFGVTSKVFRTYFRVLHEIWIHGVWLDLDLSMMEFHIKE